MPNWELKNCCKGDQVSFLVTIAIFSVVILALWRTFVMTPFKLITVFLHEASHAIACKLTCGQLVANEMFNKDILPCAISMASTSDCLVVEGIQVHANEGGVTQTRGGVYWLILPAGYLGSSFWGMALVLASTNLITARIAAGCLAVALLIVLFIAQNWTLRGLCIGVMNSLFSVYDIYDDLISRRVHTSDAEKFAELCPCPCTGVGWGVIWGVISFLFLSASIYLGLVILS
ncbi:hypothetical protein SADUNF_Sadunf04G0085100 [Salix dunnii]|uniref:Peptidase M50B-like protein n=1 Tax=Salix dunnii TaxID=1413687 RepID=A0A835K8V6_9ROSI|nr:hypothetical protein SADUNF_Sadunf04G0085100 [Salix dunnii]